MARGFESKAVDEQRQEAQVVVDVKAKPRKTAEEVDRDRQRGSIELSRSHILHELDTTKSEARFKSLEAALAHLDAELAKLV